MGGAGELGEGEVGEESGERTGSVGCDEGNENARKNSRKTQQIWHTLGTTFSS